MNSQSCSVQRQMDVESGKSILVSLNPSIAQTIFEFLFSTVCDSAHHFVCMQMQIRNECRTIELCMFFGNCCAHYVRWPSKESALTYSAYSVECVCSRFDSIGRPSIHRCGGRFIFIGFAICSDEIHCVQLISLMCPCESLASRLGKRGEIWVFRRKQNIFPFV